MPSKSYANVGKLPTALFDLAHRLARMLHGASDLDQVLGPVLRMLSEEAGLQRVALSLVQAKAELIVIEAGHGLTPAEVRRGRYRFGEGVIGRVVVHGKTARVPSIQAEPRFLDRTGALSQGVDRSFVCVPIHGESGVVGTLSAYRATVPGDELAQIAALLEICGGLLVPVVQREIAMRGAGQATVPDDSSFRPGNMIGRSKAMRRVFHLIQQVADTPTTALLTGESGTGKELAAAALHTHSARRRGPLVAINCAALPEGVIESELFGHERGAFTGAVQRRKGRFELAHGGTLFLDEIGDLSAATQIKLLRVLQERIFERLGGNETVRADVRVIAATSRDLEKMVAEGSFRADLYYRIAVFPIRLPSLRERGGDIVLLSDHFIGTYNKAHGRSVRRISTPAIDMLTSYHWPGNVRELENCIERAVLLTHDDVLHGHNLPPSLQTADASGTHPKDSLAERLDVVEKGLILDALKANNGNRAAAARDLKISERIMGLRVARYNIDATRFKSYSDR